MKRYITARIMIMSLIVIAVIVAAFSAGDVVAGAGGVASAGATHSVAAAHPDADTPWG